jgi:flagellar FliL protein
MASSDQNENASTVSATMWFVFLALATLVAGGGGAGFGLYLAENTKMTPGSAAKETVEAQAPSNTQKVGIRELPAVVTNLGQSSETWIRLQTAITFDSATVETPDVLAAEIASDIMGFMQTLSVSQLNGASGLQHLREDLNDRAIVRSDGRVRELMIESLVVQ